MTMGIQSWLRGWKFAGLLVASVGATYLAITSVNLADQHVALGIIGTIILPMSVAFGVSLVVTAVSERKEEQEQ